MNRIQRMAWRLVLPACGVVLSGVSVAARAQCELTKLTASDAAEQDLFGFSVSIDGNAALIGSLFDDDLGDDSGSAYVFRYDGIGWLETVKLTADDGADGDRFGTAVALDGDVALVGADRDADAAGSVYAYRYNGTDWAQEMKLAASDGTTLDQFGLHVALSGNTAVISSWGDDSVGVASNSGAAYVFTYAGGGWAEATKLIASDAGFGDRFGSSVAISGDTIVVGAFRNDDAGANSGSAYVFRRDGGGWVEVIKLLASDAAAGDEFGRAVAIDGDSILVGAWAHDDNGIDSGAAYVFQRDGAGWREQAKLAADDGMTSDEFGWAVDIQGDTAVIGADGVEGFAGAAYVFGRSGNEWVQQAKLTASDAAADDLLGVEVSISDGRVLLSAYGNDDTGSGSGSAYITSSISGGDCNGNGVPDACDADSDADGVPDDCDLCPFTPPSVSVDDVGCPPVRPGDVDGDGDTDLADFLACESCFSGSGQPVAPGCEACDLDDDGDMDLADLVDFQAAFTGALSDVPPAAATARFTATFDAVWSADTHPTDFPNNPHFSGLIGGTHNPSVDFWQPGELASPGIKNMAELGSKSPLRQEIEAAIQLGTAEQLISGGGIGRSPNAVSVTFGGGQTHPQVTLVSMIAPSPDWFVGVHGLPLFQDGDWVDELIIDLLPYDAGTDSGSSYASSNQPTLPTPEPISMIVGEPFLNGGVLQPLGTFTFRRIE